MSTAVRTYLMIRTQHGGLLVSRPSTRKGPSRPIPLQALALFTTPNRGPLVVRHTGPPDGHVDESVVVVTRTEPRRHHIGGAAGVGR
jgi:hypothetical protein